MTTVRIPSGYDTGRIPSQGAFRLSRARVRGYGGAMGGGKSYALCQEAWDYALDYPSILLPIFRNTHTSITNTTRKTFFEQVLPPELRGRKDLIRIKQSGGEDFCELLWNGSQIHFVGLDDPGRWFSAEVGAAFFDEAHQIQEKDVLTINSRLRQRCTACVRAGIADCQHMPHTLALTFNPSYPGHWLQQWFILGATRTEHGYRKDALIATEADYPIGDCEFFIARAADNPFLPPGYIDQALGGLSTMQRRRYLDGLWEHVDGSGFFDPDALAALTSAALETVPILVGEPAGSLTGKPDRPKLVERRNGRLECWKPPVRWGVDTKTGDEIRAHRYVAAVDASSGASADYSAIQVVDVETYEQVAEWQGKVDPDKLAEAAFLVAAVYNGALVAPEITGGFGFAVAKRLQQLIGKYEAGPDSKPRIYTRPVRDRLSQRFTDLVGWDTQVKSRAEMLTTLEEALRDGSLEVHGQRTLAELAAFAFPDVGPAGDYRAPRARSGAHDDLVVALAIAVTVASRLPKQLRRGVYTSRPAEDKPEFSSTGY